MVTFGNGDDTVYRVFCCHDGNQLARRRADEHWKFIHRRWRGWGYRTIIAKQKVSDAGTSSCSCNTKKPPPLLMRVQPIKLTNQKICGFTLGWYFPPITHINLLDDRWYNLYISVSGIFHSQITYATNTGVTINTIINVCNTNFNRYFIVLRFCLYKYKTYYVILQIYFQLFFLKGDGPGRK